MLLSLKPVRFDRTIRWVYAFLYLYSYLMNLKPKSFFDLACVCIESGLSVSKYRRATRIDMVCLLCVRAIVSQVDIANGHLGVIDKTQKETSDSHAARQINGF